MIFTRNLKALYYFVIFSFTQYQLRPANRILSSGKDSLTKALRIFVDCEANGKIRSKTGAILQPVKDVRAMEMPTAVFPDT